MMTLCEAVAVRIRALLRRDNITQYELFRRSGVPETTISALVRHVHERIMLNTLYDIAQGFGLTLEEFFDSPVFSADNIRE